MNSRKKYIYGLMTTCIVISTASVQGAYAEYFRMPLSMFTILGDKGTNSGLNPGGEPVGNGEQKPEDINEGDRGTGGTGEDGGEAPKWSIVLEPQDTFQFEIGKSITPIDFSNFVKVSGVNPRISYSVSGGQIPPGLSLTGSVLSGVPSSAKTYQTEITARDGDYSGSQTYNIVVNGVNLNIKSLSLGASHTCLVTDSNKVWCWGSASGTSGGSDTRSPWETGVTAGWVEAGTGDFTCAGITASSIKCWGNSYTGHNGTKNISNIKKIDSGLNHSCVLLNNGTVQCWGSNTYGQLGNNTTTLNTNPVTVRDLTDVVDISAGENYSCAIVSNGDIKCWGNNDQYQTGEENYKSINKVPVLVGNIPGAEKITSGESHTCILTNSGRVYCWGSGGFGRLGNGSTGNRSTPQLVTAVSNVNSISAGGLHTCATTQSNDAYCWGYGAYGATSSTNTTLSLPLKVATIAGQTLEIFAGKSHTCATTHSGLKCWGRNSNGQLGVGSNTNYLALPSLVNFGN